MGELRRSGWHEPPALPSIMRAVEGGVWAVGVVGDEDYYGMIYRK
ncbi:MAG: hypothetical protein ACRDT8_16300 [Micromonosporaceae bacterium]